jgi:beta-ketoacyl-acyl-carrier-protein synthase II
MHRRSVLENRRKDGFMKSVLFAPHRVVITGMGVASALGCTLEAFWRGLLEGKSGVCALEHLDLAQCRTRIGAPVSGYKPDEHFSLRERQRLSRSSQLALIAATQALEDAQLTSHPQELTSLGVIMGSSIGGYAASEPFFKSFFADGDVNPLTIPLIMNNAPASNVSIRFSTTGPLLSVDAACASSAHAIGQAFQLIKWGQVQKVLTGGADTALAATTIQAWSGLRVLSERNELPAEACRPFSQDRDGIVLGEGAGVLILESEQSALQRGAPILAEITGYGATSDGHHLTQPTPAGISKAMRHAMSNAGLTPQHINYINAHATGTHWNDKTETAALKEVFGTSAREIPVVGIKAALGHSVAASGALELISCVLSIRDQVIPPTINVRVRDPECDLDYVTEGARSCFVKHAISNSFAFGGSNAVLIVSNYAAEAEHEPAQA